METQKHLGSIPGRSKIFFISLTACILAIDANRPPNKQSKSCYFFGGKVDRAYV